MRRIHRPSTFLLILVAGTIYAYWSYIKYLSAAIILLLIVKIALNTIRKIRHALDSLRLRDVDEMSGIEFEYYVAALLAQCGYKNISLTEQYDYGVDIIAEKDGVRWGIQTKRYSGIVGASAVRQVVAGLRMYDCDRAMVITNSTFSAFATRLAEGNECVLFDRLSLRALVN